MKKLLRLVVSGFCLAAVLAGLAPSSTAATSTSPYIVVFKDSVSNPAAVATQQAKANGFQVSFVYSHALKGYAASFPDAALSIIRSSPQVQYVSEDGVVQALGQALPNAVRRIGGDKSSTRSGDGKGAINVNVAVLDDGIDASHPDLNVVGGTDCLQGEEGRPTSRIHGTEVGGLIGAIDNDIGVVGVAPGARLWDVTVLHGDGRGAISEVICGIDWVTGTRTDSDPTNDIAVANMSLGGPEGGASATGGCAEAAGDPQHLAICRAEAAGATFVAAAGNLSEDFGMLTPATYDDVLTATAMRDIDGQPGGLGDPARSCRPEAGPDDTAAFFSNFATLSSDRAHTVAAPGVCVSTTYPGGLYALPSGTSFAAPLVSGTVALCIASGKKPCAGLKPDQIVQKIVTDAAAYNTKNPDYGLTGDPLHTSDPNKYYGFLIRAALY